MLCKRIKTMKMMNLRGRSCPSFREWKKAQLRMILSSFDTRDMSSWQISVRVSYNRRRIVTSEAQRIGPSERHKSRASWSTIILVPLSTNKATQLSPEVHTSATLVELRTSTPSKMNPSWINSRVLQTRLPSISSVRPSKSSSYNSKTCH